MRINTSKVCLVKCNFGGLRTPVDRAIFFLVSSLTKYLMDTIDFNKHDIDIFINLAKIVRYGRHETNRTMNDDYYKLYILTTTFPMRNFFHMTIAKICPL